MEGKGKGVGGHDFFEVHLLLLVVIFHLSCRAHVILSPLESPYPHNVKYGFVGNQVLGDASEVRSSLTLSLSLHLTSVSSLKSRFLYEVCHKNLLSWTVESSNCRLHEACSPLGSELPSYPRIGVTEV